MYVSCLPCNLAGLQPAGVVGTEQQLAYEVTNVRDTVCWSTFNDLSLSVMSLCQSNDRLLTRGTAVRGQGSSDYNSFMNEKWSVSGAVILSEPSVPRLFIWQQPIPVWNDMAWAGREAASQGVVIHAGQLAVGVSRGVSLGRCLVHRGLD